MADLNRRFVFVAKDGRRCEMEENDFFSSIENATGLDRMMAIAILASNSIQHPSGEWRIEK